MVDSSGVFGAEAVADAADGFDVFAGGAELFAQALDVGVDVAARYVLVGAPDLVEELIASENATAAIVEQGEQAELERGERHLLLLDPGTVRGAVDAENAELEELLARL